MRKSQLWLYDYGMNIEVRDVTDTIISTGAMTEMGPIFSPLVPEEIHCAFAEYMTENPRKQSGTWEGRADGKLYMIRFSN
jgi:hypothetical protein